MNDDRHDDGGNEALHDPTRQLDEALHDPTRQLDEGLQGQIRQLEALVESPAGALAYPALAEAYRRDGQPERAERVAREGLARTPHGTAGRVALALALLDQKREDEVRVELARLLGSGLEDAIARDAAAREVPEEERPEPSGLSLETPEAPAAGLGLPIRGEIATLDPYPDQHAAWRPEADAPGATPEPEAPSIAVEPAAQGPFGPPPPPAPARPLVFDADGVGDDELDEAFDEAEADRDQMLGADDVAHAALSSVPEEEDAHGGLDAAARVDVADGEDELARPDAASAVAREASPSLDLAGAAADGAADEADDGGLPGPDSPFATETMAGLLERQGHGDEAARIRERIAERSARAPEPALDEHAETPASSSSVDTEATAGGRGGEATAGSRGGARKQATLERWLDNLRRDPR